jgi:putative membrane protein
MASNRLLLALGLVVLAGLVLSGLHPYDRLTWWMEVAPVLLAVPVLGATVRRFPLTRLLYLLITLHALILILGGAYTYARVPLGFWLQNVFDAGRNPYDKIGHFAQGFVPALIAREIMLRGRYVSGARLAAFLSGCVALAISAFYEFIEWWVALILGQGAEMFLGTQGDPWDTQSDMFMAMLGAIVALAALARLQDRQIAEFQGASAAVRKV